MGFVVVGDVMKFRAWDGFRMTTSGIMFNSTTGLLETAANMPLMQFTGLTDVNGNDIYEGDILWWATLLLPITVEGYHGYRFMFGKDQLCKDNAVNGEIAGNIYEDSHLVRKES